MTEPTGLVAVAVTRDEARIWSSGLEPGTRPDELRAPDERERHHHVREAQHHHGHDTDHDDVAFFEGLTDAVRGAREIILVGHGTGKANAMLRLVQYWERKHPDVARLVIGAIDSNIVAMTDAEILKSVREWWDEYREFV
jgi:hypothetical protein